MLNLLLACLLSGSTSFAAPPDSPRRGGAKLELAIGPVEIKGANDADYKPITAGTEIEENTWIRTPAKSKAVFNFSDGTELRVNENSEILFGGGRSLEVKLGEVYLVVIKSGDTFQLKLPYTTARFDGGIVNTSFVIRDPNDKEGRRVSRTLTSIHVLEGVVTVPSKRYTQDVTTGYWCTMTDGTLNTPDQIADLTIPTRWVHEILVRRGRMTSEVERRLKSMILMMGRSQGPEDLSEKGYRSLGELAAPYLAECMKYPPVPSETTRRRAIAQVLRDIATKVQIPDFVPILQDPDADTRVAAAKGLERLTGTTLKFDEAYWKGTQLEAGQKAWAEWLKKNPPKK